MAEELATLDATAQAERVRRGEIQPLELVDAAIARIERLNPQLNAVILPLFEKARRQAAGELPPGPFRGVPFLLKDLICESAGDPHHAGMRALKEAGWVSDHDSWLAARLRTAGFVFVGKTNVPELGPLPTTEPEAYGPTRNPWNTDHSPGGSSGGSAAAVAAGLVPAAHANDGGGSIRCPASECGLVGLKPSRGRTSLGPDRGEDWAGAIVEHVVTRSVRDTAAILDAVAGPMPGDPYAAPLPTRPFRSDVGAEAGRLRVGLLARSPNPDLTLHPDCVAAVREAAGLLDSLGHYVEDSHPAALEGPEGGECLGVLSSVGTARDLEAWGEKLGRSLGPADVEPYTWTFAERGRSVTATQYVAMIEKMHAFGRRVVDWWHQGFDLLLTPTLGEPPPRLGEFKPTPERPLAPAFRSMALLPFVAPFNLTGQPAISLPLSENAAHLPIGIQLVAAPYREDVLLRVAAQLEEAAPWSGRRPPVHA